MIDMKLFMVLLGCKPEGRHIEQHDVFFGIAENLAGLKSQMQEFWPGKLHIDAWREVTLVDGYRITIVPKEQSEEQPDNKLYFINLGGYQPFKFEEQHYMMLTVKPNRAAAIKEAKQTAFFKHNQATHVDDKYGVDVDDLYEIEEILAPAQKAQYRILSSFSGATKADEIHLGYLKLTALK